MANGGERFASKDPFSVDDLRNILGGGIGPVFYRTFLTDEDSAQAVTWSTALVFALCREISANCPMYHDSLCLITKKFAPEWRAAFDRAIREQIPPNLRIAIADRHWLTSSSQPSVWVDLLSGDTMPELPHTPTSLVAINADILIERLWQQVERYREESKATQGGV